VALFEVADQALYRAKSAGKNCVRSALDPDPS
jgi:PleD family two-component response regulator